MTWQHIFDQTAAHYAAMAMTRGCWQYARHQVASMERDPDHGHHWQGLREAVAQRIKAAGFRPHQDEMLPFEREPAPLQPSRRWNGR